jgi:hypothetical protein
MMIPELPFVLELVIILVLLFVVTVLMVLRSALSATPPVLSHGNPGTEEGKHR